MNIRLGFTLVVVAAATFSAAQPSRLAWTRTSNYPGIAIDTARDAIVSSTGDFVVVGSSKFGANPSKGNISVFGRKTAALSFSEITPAGGGSLELHRIVQVGANYFVFGSRRPNGSANDVNFIGKYNLSLGLVSQTTFLGNADGGSEKPTDVSVDANNNIYITGVAQKTGGGYQAFLARTNTALGVPFVGYPKIDFTAYSEPRVATVGNTAALMGVVSNNGATLRSYNSAGLVNWTTYGSSPTTTGVKVVLEKVILNGAVYLGVSGTEQVLPGVFASGGAIIKVDAATGNALARYDLAPEPGAGTLHVADIRTSSLASRTVNALFSRNGKPTLVSVNANVVHQSTWIDSIVGSVPSIIGATSWGDVILALGRSNTHENAKSLAVNNATRFSLNTPTYYLLLPHIEQDNLFHLPSGDFMTIRTDIDKMQVTVFQQAAVAVTDSYVARSGVTYRPPTPVFTNDRFYEGGSLSVVTPPMHGTVTLGSNGFFAYKSNPGYTGPDSFRYQVYKSGLNSSTAMINITVIP